MIDPFYVRQTAEASALADPQQWFRECIAEAKREGGLHGRFSVSNDGHHLLCEVWDRSTAQVMNEGGEGDQRWMLAAG